ncbi:MAG: type 4a pilus biogenesis protein PilO [Candidatus Beckwithbacteria bacterium]|nr:type 4a pilus biogenesis protein PilO [Patescibacteria group bacterium]
MKFIDRIGTSRDYDKYIERLQQLSLNPMARISGIVSLTIFTVAFFGIFAILPTFKTIASLSKEIKDIEEINQKLSIKIKTLGEAEDVYSLVVNDLNVISKVLPETADFDRLAWQIEWLAMDAGIELSSANFGEFQIVGIETIKDGLGKINVKITITGNYLQIKEFIKKLSKIDRLIAISDVRMNDLTTNIQFDAYYLPGNIPNL